MVATAAAKGQGRAQGKCGGRGFTPPRSIAPAATEPAHVSNFLIAPYTFHLPPCPVDVGHATWPSVCERGVQFVNSNGAGRVRCCACAKKKKPIGFRGLEGLRDHATAMVEAGVRKDPHTALLSLILLATPPAPAPAPAEPKSPPSVTAPGPSCRCGYWEQKRGIFAITPSDGT